MRKRGKIILYIIVGVILLLGISVLIDYRRNSSVTVMPSRPEVPLGGSMDFVYYAFENNEEILEDELQHHIDEVTRYIDGRYDCADFRLVSLIKILYEYPEKLSAAQHNQIKKTLLNFKYWLDEPGDDSMCYWSENHQILFASAEYLVGKLYPHDIFPNLGITGEERMEKGKKRILTWLEQRWRYGFIEWYSNVYYTEDIAPLSNLIDLAEDPEIVTKSQIIMDLLLYDLASQSFKGTFVSTSGRAYERNRKSGVHSSMKSVAQHIWGYELGGEGRKGMDLNFIYIDNYKVPEVIKAIGYDTTPQIIKASTGLDVSELKRQKLIGVKDEQIMMQWGMESFTNREIVNNSIDIINKYDLLSQSSFNDFSMINFQALRRLGLLPVVVNVLNPQTHGNAIQRANTYTYKTNSFSMATAQNYHPGSYGDQQHVFSTTLSNELSIFVSHPAVWPEDKGPNGNSPTYWVGYGHLPHSVQDINVNLSLFILPEKKGVMEKRLIDYTHAWFPEEYFDQVEVEETHIFGRLGDTYVGIKSYMPIEYVDPERLTKDGSSDPKGRREVIQQGKESWWITEVSTKAEEGDFTAFMDRIRSNPADYNDGQLTYKSGDRLFDLRYKGDFLLNGVVVETDYPRFDAPYIEAPRDPKTLTFSWEGQELFLDFYGMVREERSLD